MPDLHIRRFGNDQSVKTIPVKVAVPLNDAGQRYLEKAMMGLLRNLNTDVYYVDDSEFYPAEQPEGESLQIETEE